MLACALFSVYIPFFLIPKLGKHLKKDVYPILRVPSSTSHGLDHPPTPPTSYMPPIFFFWAAVFCKG